MRLFPQINLGPKSKPKSRNEYVGWRHIPDRIMREAQSYAEPIACARFDQYQSMNKATRSLDSLIGDFSRGYLAEKLVQGQLRRLGFSTQLNAEVKSTKQRGFDPDLNGDIKVHVKSSNNAIPGYPESWGFEDEDPLVRGATQYTDEYCAGVIIHHRHIAIRWILHAIDLQNVGFGDSYDGERSRKRWIYLDDEMSTIGIRQYAVARGYA